MSTENQTRLQTSSAVSFRQAEADLEDLARLSGKAGAIHSQRGSNPVLGPEERYRALIEQIPAVVFLAQLEGGLGEAYVSPQIEAILGFTQEEWLGNPVLWFRQLHPDDKDRWSVEAAQFFMTGEPLKATYRVLARDGSTVWFRCEAKMVRHENGQPWFIHGVGFDISEMKRAEALLEQAHAQLESRVAERTADLVRVTAEAQAASRSKSDFLATMSHEIRTPMNGVVGMTQVLLETPLSEDQREAAETIKESANSLLTIINNILDFSKIEAGKLELESTSFKLSDVVNGVVRLLAERARSVGLRLTARQPLPDCRVTGDPTWLRQILLNLVGNAIKFTAQGSVTVAVEKMDAMWHFSVEDTGIGIAADKQGAIFEAFTQVDNSISRRFGGTGLGLAICSRLVQAMGGRIWLESESGLGTTFHFTAALGQDAEVLAPDGPVVPATLADVIVLALDPSAESRENLREVLLRFGMKPALYEDAPSVLAAFEEANRRGAPFPIVLLDREESSRGELRIVDQIRLYNRRSRIVVLTSDCGSCDTAACRSLGVDAFVSKPFDESYLERILRSMVTDSADRRPTCDQLQAGAALHGGPLRILLVEDNVVNQRIAAAVLGKRGHLITVANDGNEGVAAALREDFDVILMDVQMPGMNGWEATAAIRAHERDSGGHVPIIAMTAHAFKEDIERCTAAGMDGYVSKPFEIKALLNELARVLATEKAGGALILFAQAIADSQPNAPVQQHSFLDP